jgi:hypothetical protein
MNAFRGIYRVWATILTAAVVVQIFFAGFGAFDTVHKVSSDGATVDESSVEDSFGVHIGLGYLILFGTVLLLLISFGTRDRRRIYRSLGVVGLLVLQILLAGFGEDVPYLGGLHPINAFIILGFLASITYREWKGRAEVAEAAPATAPTA